MDSTYLIISFHTSNPLLVSFFPCMQIRRRIIGLIGDEATAASVLGANFSAGFVAGSLAAAATCPLDVAKTRRQIEVISLNQVLLNSYSFSRFGHCALLNPSIKHKSSVINKLRAFEKYENW